MAWLELKIPPPLVAIVIGLAMFGASSIVPALSFVLPESVVVAIFLGLLGVSVALAGVVTFRRQHTTLNPTTPEAASSVVSIGVYRYTRNPMYLGLFLILAGLAVYFSNAGSIALLAAYIAYMNQFQIKPEERALQAKFGPAYVKYKTRVRRWI